MQLDDVKEYATTQCNAKQHEGTQQSMRCWAMGQGKMTMKQRGMARIRHDAM